MIIAPISGQLLVITQTDHAHLAGELLTLWRSDGVSDHPRRDALLFAAREHDNGWAEMDSAPMCDPESGRPLDFMAIPEDTRWEIWRRGTWRHVERAPYAALLIIRHAIHLHRSRLRNPEGSNLLAEWHDLEAELMATTGVAKASVDHDYRWIELTDSLSLTVCNRWTQELECHGLRGVLHGTEDISGDDIEAEKPVAGGTLVLDPFPLAGTTTFRVACRLIPDRPYTSDTDLAIELATARWRHYAVRVAAGV